MEGVTYGVYMHAKRVYKKFEIILIIIIKNNDHNFKNNNHNLYRKSDALSLGVVFENFRKIHLKIYYLDPKKVLSAPGLAWKAALKKTEVKWELSTEIDMLLIIKKGIRGGICYANHW